LTARDARGFDFKCARGELATSSRARASRARARREGVPIGARDVRERARASARARVTRARAREAIEIACPRARRPTGMRSGVRCARTRRAGRSVGDVWGMKLFLETRASANARASESTRDRRSDGGY